MTAKKRAKIQISGLPSPIPSCFGTPDQLTPSSEATETTAIQSVTSETRNIIVLDIVGKLPLLNLIGKDGRLTPTLIAFGAYTLCCGVKKVLRLRFPDVLGNYLSQYVSVRDTLRIYNFCLPNDLEFQEEIQFGVYLNQWIPEDQSLIDFPQVAPIQQSKTNVTKCFPLHLVTLVFTRPSYLEPLIVSYFYASSRVWCFSQPEWTSQKHLNWNVLPTLNSFPGGQRVWDLYCHKTHGALESNESDSPPESRSVMLLYIPIHEDTSFYGCIVGSSCRLRKITFPNLGSFVALDVDIVDYSMVSSFRMSLLSNNQIKYLLCSHKNSC